MGPPLGPTLANALLVYQEKNWLERCPLEHRPFYYRRYVDDIFVLFNFICFNCFLELLELSCQHISYYKK